MNTSKKDNSKKRRLSIQKKNIFDFYSAKKTKKQVYTTKNVEIVTLTSDEEEESHSKELHFGDDGDDITFIKEERSVKAEILLKNTTLQEPVNTKNEAERLNFALNTVVLKTDLNDKANIYRPAVLPSHEGNVEINAKPIPSYRVHSFPSQDNKAADNITVDYFPKIAVTKYHFISHLHADHHVGFSKKWLSNNPEAIIVLSYQNYLPFLYKFNLVNYKSLKKPLSDDFKATTDRILVVGEDSPLTIFLNSFDDTKLVVKTLDANHCIGAVLLWIEYYDGDGVFRERILHTGDFRYSPAQMLPCLKGHKFDKIFLDTTYLSPIWNFTPKDELLELVFKFMHDKLLPTIMDRWFHKNNLIQKTLDSFFHVSIDDKTVKTVIVLGSYTIGKEFLAAGLSKKFKNCPVILDKLGFRASFDLPSGNFIRSIDFQADITEQLKTHDVVIFLGSIRDSNNIKKELKLYLVEKHYNKLLTISISLSGWNFYKWKNSFQDLDSVESLPSFNTNTCTDILHDFNSNAYVKKRFNIEEITNSNLIFKEDFDLDLNNLPKWIIKHDKDNKVIFWKLSYSDHSSYKELSAFCEDLNYDEIIPTVNNHKSELLSYHLKLWKMCNKIKK